MGSRCNGGAEQPPSDDGKKRNGTTIRVVSGLPLSAPENRGSNMTSGAHFTDHCEKFLNLVEEAAELLHAKANNYFDSDLAKTATSLIDVSYQLRKEVLVEKATTILANALIRDDADPYEVARPIIAQIKEIDQAYKDYRTISGTDECVEI